MEIRNVTPEQIEQAMEEATKNYNGNLYLKANTVQVKLPKAEQTTEVRSYTAREGWRVIEIKPDGREIDAGYYPNVQTMSLSGKRLIETEEELLSAQMALCEKRAAEFEGMKDAIGAAGSTFVARFVPAHEKSYTVEHNHEYVTSKAVPLGKKGTRYRVWIAVHSSRRPGARVSQERYGLHGMPTNKPKRIGSACWHAHRDFFREIFAINPDAEIHTALAKYKGEEDFEKKFPRTAHGEGHAGAAPIANIGDACNCDEGDYPEYAVEGLTDEQYDFRAPIWADYPDYCHIKPPKRSKATRDLNAGVSQEVVA